MQHAGLARMCTWCVLATARPSAAAKNTRYTRAGQPRVGDFQTTIATARGCQQFPMIISTRACDLDDPFLIEEPTNHGTQRNVRGLEWHSIESNTMAWSDLKYRTLRNREEQDAGKREHVRESEGTCHPPPGRPTCASKLQAPTRHSAVPSHPRAPGIGRTETDPRPKRECTTEDRAPPTLKGVQRAQSERGRKTCLQVHVRGVLVRTPCPDTHTIALRE